MYRFINIKIFLCAVVLSAGGCGSTSKSTGSTETVENGSTETEGNGSTETEGNGNSIAQPENKTSGGNIELSELRISRNECFSPCPVILSIDKIVDSTSDYPFSDSGVHWDYGDNDADETHGRFERGAQYFNSGRISGTGASRESDTNTPLGMHTYYCETGTCVYYPGVSVQNTNGDWATAWQTITVHAPNDYFSNQSTYCYSSVGDFNDCPSEAHQVTSNVLPNLNEWQSDARYLLRKGEHFEGFNSGDICIPLDNKNILIASYGEGDVKPELDNDLIIGVDANCGDRIVEDAQVLNYSVNRWLENITVTDLRIPNLILGQTLEQMSFHDIDMDYEDSTTEGGGISMFNSNNCSKTNSLDCANVPLPKGLYFSSMDIIGSRTSPPIYNIGLLESVCISFIGVLDVNIGISYGHSMRVQCSSRTIVAHSDFIGEHLDLAGGARNSLTLRPSGNLEIDMLDQVRRSDDVADGGFNNLYQDRYSAVKDVYFGTPESVNNSAPIKIAPAKTADATITRHAVISGIVTDLSGGTGDGPATRDVSFAGTGLTCYDDNLLETQQGCSDINEGAIPNGGFEPSRTIAAPVAPQAPDQY